MSRVRVRDTDLERLVRAKLRQLGLRFRVQYRALPGRPDIVFVTNRVAVFVDGDFWHGYRFPVWRSSLAEFWQQKIAANRRRDRRNFQRLRRRGWIVVRIWQHSIESDLEVAVGRLLAALQRKQRQNRIPVAN
jgi:DNA mismatch endonuclease (patch repair protein)